MRNVLLSALAGLISSAAPAQSRLLTIPSDQCADQVFAQAEKRFGKPAMVDLVGINADGVLLATQLNAARDVMPQDGRPLPCLPE